MAGEEDRGRGSSRRASVAESSTSRRASPEGATVPSRYRNRAYPRSFASVGERHGEVPRAQVRHLPRSLRRRRQDCAHNAASAASASRGCERQAARRTSRAPKLRWAEERCKIVSGTVLKNNKRSVSRAGFASVSETASDDGRDDALVHATDDKCDTRRRIASCQVAFYYRGRIPAIAAVPRTIVCARLRLKHYGREGFIFLFSRRLGA